MGDAGAASAEMHSQIHGRKGKSYGHGGSAHIVAGQSVEGYGGYCEDLDEWQRDIINWSSIRKEDRSSLHVLGSM